MSQELRAEIKAMLVTELKVSPEEITDEIPLFGPEGLALDSIDALEIAVWMEKHHGVKLSDSNTARSALASVNAIHDFIVTNRAS